MVKKRIIKKFEQLPVDIIEQIRDEFQDGFEDYLITFTNLRGEIELALPYETESISYLIKMPKDHIPEEDEDSDGAPVGGFDNFENLELADEVSDDEEDED